jgi:hypothetical protein
MEGKAICVGDVCVGCVGDEVRFNDTGFLRCTSVYSEDRQGDFVEFKSRFTGFDDSIDSAVVEVEEFNSTTDEICAKSYKYSIARGNGNETWVRKAKLEDCLIHRVGERWFVEWADKLWFISANEQKDCIASRFLKSQI